MISYGETKSGLKLVNIWDYFHLKFSYMLSRFFLSSSFFSLILICILVDIAQGTFLPLVIPPTIIQGGLWLIWLTVICCLKMFQALGRDRLDHLNASPSVTPWAYFHVFSVFLFVLSFSFFWYCSMIGLSFVLYKTLNPSMFLPLFFEPLSITFETMQAILVHGFQLLEISFHAVGNTVDCQRSKLFDLSVAGISALFFWHGWRGSLLLAFCLFPALSSSYFLLMIAPTGSFWEWKGILIRNLGFFLDLATLIMAVGHYVLIWWLHGMAFHLADAVLFLNIRALLTAIVKRVKGFIKLRMALGALHAALPDATSEEIQAYDDECVICRESMAKAKKLHCNHLFHLSCLRSWLDQGLNEAYSCPTCRKPLFLGRTENEVNYRQINSGLDRQNMPGHTLATGVFPNQMQNPVEGSPWRSAGLDSGWPHSWPTQSVDGAGPSTGVGSVGLGRVHMMMRHLASVGDTAVEHTAWSPWSMNPSQAAASVSSVPPNVGGRYPGNAGSLRMRTTPSTGNGNIANILTMTETV
ncbi:hypothetical protein Gohar_014683 [Gossypium harknessii]|uniref:RING-type domain-containing protein n=1 Tax=Gossypium harknessii TaxID=34285 RepID=A0A7J9FXG1_9ROSI|nr:hypothetical protein [Gossypium harknessii]